MRTDTEQSLKEQAEATGMIYKGYDGEFYNFIWPCDEDSERQFRIPDFEVELIGVENILQGFVDSEKRVEAMASALKDFTP